MHARAATERLRPPLALARQLQLHAATHRLRDAEGAAQRLHLQVVLRLLPSRQAGFERMGGGGLRDGGAGGRCRRGEVISEGVVDAGGGGGAFGEG